MAEFSMLTPAQWRAQNPGVDYQQIADYEQTYYARYQQYAYQQDVIREQTAQATESAALQSRTGFQPGGGTVDMASVGGGQPGNKYLSAAEAEARAPNSPESIKARAAEVKGSPEWWSQQIAARESAARANTLENPVTSKTPGYFENIAPTYQPGSPEWYRQIAQARVDEPGGAVARTPLTPSQADQFKQIVAASTKSPEWWGEQIAGREAAARMNTEKAPLNPNSPEYLAFAKTGPAGSPDNGIFSVSSRPPGYPETNYFAEVSKAFEEAPVLSFFYGLGKWAGDGGRARASSGWLESAPIESIIFAGGRIFEGREDVKIAQKNYADIYRANLEAGLIDKGTFVGTEGQYTQLTGARQAADTAAANQARLEAPVFGGQTVPGSMPLAAWSTGASEMIRSTGDSLISGGDTLVPAASPLTRFVVGTGEGVVSLIPFAALAVPAGEWAVRNPAAAGMAIVPGLAQQAQTMTGQAREDLPRFGGNIAGMLIAGKIAGDIYETFPYRLKYGEVRLPIETPKGLPKTETVEMGYNRILESVRENGIETYNRAALGEPQNYILRMQEQPVQYFATWKGVYLDVQGRTQIFGKTIFTGSPYEGKYPIAGIGYEAGGEFLGAMRDRPYIGPAIEAAIKLPGVRSAVDIIERSPSVPTGLWTGPGSVRAFGANVESRVSGAIDFLGLGQSPASAALKLQAAGSLGPGHQSVPAGNIIPAKETAVVRALIDLREITQRHPGLITVKEPYGEITPTSMSPEAFRDIIGYMNANPESMRVYGSLVGRSYTGEFGRASLGDVDALLKSSGIQTHAEAMSDILLNTEHGAGSFEAIRTEKIYSTIGKSGKIERIINTKIEYRDIQTGEVIGKLETVPSQITDTRVTFTKPGVGHVLDLHPVKNLKYSEEIPGIGVRSIPIEDLIWGKQTIGNPPIGTVIVSRTGAEVVVEMGGRVKDFFDSYAFARTAAADAYLNPRIALSDAMRLERASSILGERVGVVAKTEPSIARFVQEIRDPFSTAEIQSAKMTKIIDAASGSTRYYSGLPMDEYAISDYVGDLTDRIYRYSFTAPISSSQYAMFDRYSVSIDDYSDRYSDEPDVMTPTNYPVNLMESVHHQSLISDSSHFASASYDTSSVARSPSAWISGPSGSRPSLIDVPYTPGYPAPPGPSRITPYNPLGSGLPYGSLLSPRESPPTRIVHTYPPEHNLDWIRSHRKKRPARFLELFSFEEGEGSLIPERFGRGGVTVKAITRNPRAAYIPGFRGRAENILMSEDIAPNRLFDILGSSGRRQKRSPLWEDLLS